MDGYSRAISSLSDLILEQTSDALIYANREGVIERWNQAAESMFGYTFAVALFVAFANLLNGLLAHAIEEPVVALNRFSYRQRHWQRYRKNCL